MEDRKDLAGEQTTVAPGHVVRQEVLERLDLERCELSTLASVFRSLSAEHLPRPRLERSRV